MRCLRPLAAVLAVAFICLSTAQGALVSRLGGLAYYDEEQDITWIADFNLAASNTFGLSYSTNLGNHPNDPYGSSYTEQILAGGSMNWGAALWWIDAMNAANYLGADSWRLPTAPDNDGTCDGFDGTFGLNCTGSEMGYLYYMHGITGATPGPFSNIQGADWAIYWTGTEYAVSNTAAHVFRFDTGYSDVYSKYLTSDPDFAVAVLDGDIAAMVPLPPAVVLLGSAIAFLGWLRRRAA